MGCGVQKASTDSIQKVNEQYEDGVSPSLNISPIVRRQTDEGNLGTIGHSQFRFTRNSEMISYFERDPSRPSRNSEMLQAYRSLLMSPTETEDRGDLSYKTKSPTATLALEYVYGYKCCATSQNLFYSANADIVVYPCGAVIVLLNKTSNTQRFLGAGDLKDAPGHSDDILSLTISRNREFLASGEVGSNPAICVWKAGDWTRPLKTMEQGVGSEGVGRLAFTSDGKLLLAVDIAQNQRVRVFDWKSETVLQFTDSSPRGRVLSCSWNHKGLSFCTVNPVCFWVKAVHGYEKTVGNAAPGKEEIVMNVADWLSTGNCVTGGVNGKLYLWSDSKPIKIVQVLSKNSAIHSLSIVNDFIITGGEDNTVHLLDATFKEIRQVDVSCWPKSLDLSGDTILCGTRDGVIQEFRGHQRTVLMEAHSDGDVWSVALDSTDSRILVSTGDDNKIKCWDLSQRKCVSTAIIEANACSMDTQIDQMAIRSEQSRALCISPKGQIAVGHNDGHVTIRMGLLQLNNILAVLRDAQDWIQVLSYSPSSAYLAVGSHDSVVYIYDVNANYKLFFKLAGHSSPIVSIDWSVSESLLKTCALNGELCFWEIETETRLPSEDERVAAEPWATWTSAEGFPVRGVRQLLSDPRFVTCVSRSLDQKYVVVGNEWGLVELYSYPNGPGSKANVYRAHSVEVANVLWTARDELITTGGCDLSIMQWRLVER